MKNTQWQDVFGNLVGATEIATRATDEGMSLESWVTHELDALASANPGEGYAEYNDGDIEMFAFQIEDEATDAQYI